MCAATASDATTPPPPRAIALVGLTGVGKSTLGRRLATELDLPFVDSDREIELAARLSIQDIFETFGEPAFREGEQRVIGRLLDGESKVIATGGGAMASPRTRQALARGAFTVWLRTDVETIIKRLATSRVRPILSGADPAEVLRNLSRVRAAHYATADLTFDLESAVTGAPALATLLRARLPWLDAEQR